MTSGHARSDFAATLARQREQIGTELLVSSAQDRAGAEVGGMAWERLPDLADHLARGGTIVETWRNDDGEPGVVTVGIRGRRGQLDARVARLALSDCSQVEPPSDYRALKTARQLMAILGQRSAANGPPLNDFEARLVGWVWSLLTACGSGPTREAA